MMIKKLLLSLWLLFPCFSFAFEWPVENRIPAGTFGANDGKHFQSSIVLGGKEQPVFPIAEGEVLFYHTTETGFRSVPRGNGNFMVLQHEGEIQSVYSHLAPGSMDTSLTRLKQKPQALEQKLVDNLKAQPGLSKEEQYLLEQGLVKNEADNTYLVNKELGAGERARLWSLLCRRGPIPVVGFTGNTETDMARLLQLHIFDVKEDLVMNPLHKSVERTLLNPPLEPRREYNANGPLIKKVYLKRGDVAGAAYEEITNNQLIKAGEAELAVNVFTGVRQAGADYKLAPFHFSVFLSGREITSLNFYALAEKNGRLVVWKTDLQCSELYAGEWLYHLARLKLVEGNVVLQIKVEDLFGLVTTGEYNLKVGP